MRHTITIIFCLAMALSVGAQGSHQGGRPGGHQGSHQGNPQGQRFSPEKFDQELQAFITTEACLTTQEAAKFFPLLKEMQAKQREIFAKQKEQGRNKPQDEKSCLKAIREHDEMEMELKRIQQAYHEKFLEILPASKVYDILQAEERFHRRMLKKWSHNRPPEPPRQPQK